MLTSKKNALRGTIAAAVLLAAGGLMLGGTSAEAQNYSTWNGNGYYSTSPYYNAYEAHRAWWRWHQYWRWYHQYYR